MLNPSVWVVMEGTGVVVTTLPPFTSMPPVDSHMYLSADGGAATKYKIEGIETHAETVSQSGPVSPTKTGVNCHINLIVSVVT